jgi:hypothetical protein
MKHLKSYKLFESKDYSQFYELFQELQDEGFRITVSESNTRKLDFSKSDVIDIHYMEEVPGTLESIKTTYVKIEKRIVDDTHVGLTLKEFNIDEIKENLRFVESFAKEQFGLEIEYIYTMRVPRYLYYKSVESLPENQTLDSVTVAFRNI